MIYVVAIGLVDSVGGVIIPIFIFWFHGLFFLLLGYLLIGVC